jgi:hypothetical protein
VIPINVSEALQDPTLAESAQEWPGYEGKIWLDESEEAVVTGIASERVAERLATAPVRAKSNVKWRWIRNGLIVVLAGITALAIGLGLLAKKSADEALRQRDEKEIARKGEAEQKAEAEKQRDIAEKRMRIAQARQLAAQSNSFRESFPQRSLLLAAASIFRTLNTDGVTIPAAEQALIESLSVTGGVPVRGHEDSVSSVSFSADDRRLASGSYDNTVRIWDLELKKLCSEACEVAGRNLTCKEWQQFFTDEPYSPICTDLPFPKDCGKKAKAE